MASIFNFFKKSEQATDQTDESRGMVQYRDGGNQATVIDWSGYGNGVDADKLSVVYGCVNLRASTIASLPVQLNRKLANGGHEVAKDSELHRLLTLKPNRFQTAFQFFQWVFSRLDLHGNAFVRKRLNGYGEVMELLPLDVGSVEITVTDEHIVYKLGIGGEIVTYTDNEIIHFKGYSRDGILGVSLINHFKNLFDGYNNLEKSGEQIIKNAAKPNGVVYHPGNVKDDELEKLQRRWQSNFSGNNSGKTAWLPNTYKIDGIPSGITAADSQFIAQKVFSAQRIASDIFRVPPHMIAGLSSNPTYASVEQMSIEWVQYGLNPVIRNVEQTLQVALLADDPDLYFKFNVNGLLRGDVNSRINYYKFCLEHGVFTPNKVNELEDTGVVVPDSAGGNTYSRPLNYGPAGAQQTAASN